MATLASTQVSAYSASLPIPQGPFHVEFWRIAGGAAADTAAITPARGRYVIAAFCGGAASTTLGTLGTDTNVTFTLLVSAATNVTFDAYLVVQD